MNDKKSSVYNTFQIIRHHGTPSKGQLPDGTWVYARDRIQPPDMVNFIPCARYDDHFIYEVPVGVRHRFPGPVYRCSCGSAVVFVGSNVNVAMGNSPSGAMFVCQFHADNGHHATGGARWV